jgi:hypothetical protein
VGSSVQLLRTDNLAKIRAILYQHEISLFLPGSYHKYLRGIIGFEQSCAKMV